MAAKWKHGVCLPAGGYASTQPLAAIPAASLRAIFQLIPYLCPFLPPGERPAACHTCLVRQVGLFDVFSHRGNILPFAPGANPGSYGNRRAVPVKIHGARACSICLLENRLNAAAG